MCVFIGRLSRHEEVKCSAFALAHRSNTIITLVIVLLLLLLLWLELLPPPLVVPHHHHHHQCSKYLWCVFAFVCVIQKY